MNPSIRSQVFKHCPWSLAFAALFLSAVLARAQEPRPDCFVLSVGIDRYPQTPLKGCANDARNLAEQFQKQQGKLFGRVNVRLLLDDKGTRA
jgi:hypothetical protein